MVNRFTEEVAVLGTIDPEAMGTGTDGTDIIDMHYWGEVAFVLLLGTMAASATADFIIQASANADMSSAVTFRSATQLTQAGSDGDKQVILTVRDDELAGDGYRYVRGKLTIGTDACDIAVVALGYDARFKPASDNDLSSVDEIKNS